MTDNTMEMKYHCNQSIQTIPSNILPPALIIVFLLGLPGNLLAMYVFCRNLHSWRPTVLFLFNLVIADVLLLVSLPFRVHYYLHHEDWEFGDAWCRINLFMLAVNRSASISFMSALAVDRYLKIVHPHHNVSNIGPQQASMIAGLIWTVVILLRIPLLTNNLVDKGHINNNTFCRSFIPFEDPPLGIKLHYAVYISEFFLALILLLYCSLRIYLIFRHRNLDRRRNVRRAIRIVLVIVTVFIICFSPGVATGLSALYVKSLGEKYCKTFHLIGQWFVTAIGMTYLNSVLDPVIYGFSSSMFRDALVSSMKRIRIRKILTSRQTTPNQCNG